MFLRWKATHIKTGFCQDGFRALLADAWDFVQLFHRLFVFAHVLLDQGIHLADSFRHVINMRHDLPYQLLLQGRQKAIHCLHDIFDSVPKGSVEACFYVVPLQAGILFQHLLQKVARTFAIDVGNDTGKLDIASLVVVKHFCNISVQ